MLFFKRHLEVVLLYLLLYSDLEEEEQLKAFLMIVPDEEGEIDYEVLNKRYLIVDWEYKFYHTDRYGKPHDYYKIFRADKMIFRRIKKNGFLGVGISMITRMLALRLIAEFESKAVFDLLRFIQQQIDESGSHDGTLAIPEQTATDGDKDWKPKNAKDDKVTKEFKFIKEQIKDYKAVRHRYSKPMIQPEPEGSTEGYPLVSVEVLRFDTSAGNPVKEILLKLNLPDHRSILTDSKEYVKMVMEVPDSS
ncbi:hypothetical protein Tco_0041168 [Tanacetum coccineum]